MSKVFIEETTLTSIGDAIRAKTGKTALIAPLNMAQEISTISGGGGGEGSNQDLVKLLNGTLTYIKIPDEVTSLTSHAFYQTAISNIDLNNVTKLGSYSLGYTKNLKNVDLSKITDIGANCFAQAGIESADLSHIVSIGASAFDTCSSLTEVIGFEQNGVKTIPTYCFSKCQLLESINLENVEIIGNYAFAQCRLLTELRLTNVKQIYPNAFDANYYSNKQHTTEAIVDIGPNCATIGEKAFTDWTKIRHLIVRATTPPTLANANAFSWSFPASGTVPTGNHIYVPKASLSAYMSATNWSTYVNDGTVYRAIEDYPEITGG